MNPRIAVLQTAPLGHLGTAPKAISTCDYITTSVKSLSEMKKAIFITISALLVFVGGYLLYTKVVKPMVLEPQAELSAHCQGCKAVVFLEGKKLGTTPLKSIKVPAKDSKIILSNGVNTFENEISLTPKTRTVVNRDLGPNEIFSAGEIIWMEKSDLGETISVLSNPVGATVKLDGQEIGTSPLTTDKLSLGEHTIEIIKENYESRGLTISVKENHKINIDVQLYPIPALKEPSEIDLGETPYQVFDVSTNNPVLFSDPASWAQGTAHWLKTRASKQIDFFIDFDGNVYGTEGKAYSTDQETDLSETKIYYLGKAGREGLAPKAKAALESLATGQETDIEDVLNEEKVEILPTGLGWLRVRSEPGLSGEEVARVDVGNTYTLIDEESGWYQIELEDGETGWVSGQYAEKVEPEEEESEESEETTE